MFTGSIQVKRDPETQDRFPHRIAGLSVWPDWGFTGAGQERGSLRTGGREALTNKDSLSHIPLG